MFSSTPPPPTQCRLRRGNPWAKRLATGLMASLLSWLPFQAVASPDVERPAAAEREFHPVGDRDEQQAELSESKRNGRVRALETSCLKLPSANLCAGGALAVLRPPTLSLCPEHGTARWMVDSPPWVRDPGLRMPRAQAPPA